MTQSQRFLHFFDRRLARHLTSLLGTALFFIAFFTYASTVPPVQVFGDPSEYTFIPWVLGIAHPPGYAFYTLLAAMWQRLVPIGSVAFRTHLLASTAGALSATLVYLAVLRLISHSQRSERSEAQSTPSGPPTCHWRVGHGQNALPHLPALFAGLSLAAAADIWQHSIH